MLSFFSDDVIWLSNQIINNLKLLETNFSIKICDWDALIMKSVMTGLTETNPKYGFIKVLRKLIKKADIDKSIISKSFGLLVGHSQFSNIMLNRNVQQQQKGNLIIIQQLHFECFKLTYVLPFRRSIEMY